MKNKLSIVYAYLKKNLINPIFGSFIIFLIVQITLVIFLLQNKVDKDIIAVSITSVVVMFGYFLAHYLETYRKEREKKLEQYIALLRSLKCFLGEPGNNQEDLKKQREEYQNAYLSSTLLISSKAYSHFRDFMNELNGLQTSTISNDNSELLKKQNLFVNELRKEFRPYDEIEFKTDRIVFRN